MDSASFDVLGQKWTSTLSLVRAAQALQNWIEEHGLLERGKEYVNEYGIREVYLAADASAAAVLSNDDVTSLRKLILDQNESLRIASPLFGDDLLKCFTEATSIIESGLFTVSGQVTLDCCSGERAYEQLDDGLASLDNDIFDLAKQCLGEWGAYLSTLIFRNGSTENQKAVERAFHSKRFQKSQLPIAPSSPENPAQPPPSSAYGIRHETFSVVKDGKQYVLGCTKEFHFLARLWEERGTFVSHEDLLDALGRKKEHYPRLDYVVSRLKNRLKDLKLPELRTAIRANNKHYGIFLD